MQQRVFVPLMLLLPALLPPVQALGQSATTDGQEPARYSLSTRAPAFGLRLDPAPEQPAQRPPAVHFSRSSSLHREGWSAFGTMGPMRWAKSLSEDESMAWRIGGRVPGMPSSAQTGALPKRLNIGLQYRF